MSEYVYAILDSNEKVINIVSSDNENSEEILMQLIEDAYMVVLSNDDTGMPYIGGDYLQNKFRIPSPYNSWQWNQDSWSWESPVPYPQDGKLYIWDENFVNWIEVVSPEEIQE
jgi:hypothetical protein